MGAGVSKQITRHLYSLEAIQKADLGLPPINEVGEIVTKPRNFFEQGSSGKIIEQLVSAGLNK